MCDYSLEARESRAARIGERIRSTAFPNTPTRGFCPADEPAVAVCLLPGTELAFERPIGWQGLWARFVYGLGRSRSSTAVFRKVNEDNPGTHHDALELADGAVILLTHLRENQVARVIQLPVAGAGEAEPRDAHAEVQEAETLEPVAG